ncbi:tetratricopeptide repeat protein [Cognaticolwellia mytili]|uniref:tetratricopeptide repeat protein n=1 Tax=Cognaticolwellia mytili TaxID=1888913 RepID=UPI000A172A82|nr:sel1 repeat family protein [Cognaticolwellia mytili]
MSDGNLKAPSQVFKWFEKMKENYDKNILAILQRFEQSNSQQQSRIDETHRSHINIMRENHLNQNAQFTKQIEQQKQEIDYFKQQIAQQQQTISQLNNRYDAVIVELITHKKSTTQFKDIFDDSCFIDTDSTSFDSIPINDSLVKQSPVSSKANNVSSKNNDVEIGVEKETNEIYFLALEMRNSNNNEQAFIHFKKAANLGHVLAMGALGRAYFLAEGIEENHAIGLSWLINAANLALPQAIKRVEYFKTNEPALYQTALKLSKKVTSDVTI